MVGVAFKMTRPDYSVLHRERDRFKADYKRAALDVADLAGEKMYRHTQAKIRSVGLKKLANAVGFTSAKRKRQLDRTAYGVMYAKGGDESLAGGALESYSQGTTITPSAGNTWLAVPTPAAPKLVTAGGRRRRLTPALWEQAGLDQRIGPLIFIAVSSRVALLVVRQVSLSPKTGQAKRLGPRATRTRIPRRQVTVFVLIRQTRRAKRFDKDEIAAIYHDRIPDYMRRTLAGYQRGFR